MPRLGWCHPGTLSAWTTVTTGATASPGGTITKLMVRRVSQGGAPLPISVDVTELNSGAATALTAAQVAGVGLEADATAASPVWKPAALIGDSITGQHFSIAGGGNPRSGVQGPWNWANWLVGSPFVFEQVCGASGGVASDIFARVAQIPPRVGTVFVLAGTNDIIAVSSSANSATRDAAVAALTGAILAGLQALRTMGKKIAIATVPPNAAYTAGDSRIDVLDRVNAWIATTPALGVAVGFWTCSRLHPSGLGYASVRVRA